MDQRAEFQVLVASILDSTYGYARVLSRSESDAEDLLQDTLLRAYQGFGSFKRHLSFKVWLFSIMKNANIDRERRRSVRPAEAEWPGDEALPPGLAEAGLTCPAPPSPEEILVARITVDEVREAIRRLPTLFREAVELRDIEGLSYEEIAAVTGTPSGTVMSRLHRGRALLRIFLQGTAGERTRSRDAYGL